MSPCNQEYMDRCGWRGWDIDRNGSEVDFGNPGLGGGSSSCQPYSSQHYTEYYTSVLLYYTINILCSVSGGAAVSSPNLIVCYISHFYVCIVDPRCVGECACVCVCVCACVFVLSIRGCRCVCLCMCLCMCMCLCACIVDPRCVWGRSEVWKHLSARSSQTPPVNFFPHFYTL